MSSPGSARRFLGTVFVITLVAYVGLYALDTWVRTRRGPWIVSFERDAVGAPALRISQPTLGVQDVRVLFPGESATNMPAVIRFDRPSQAVPWGTVVFSDTTYLPGTITLQAFGHEVELLPRALFLNRRAVVWQSGQTHELRPSDRPATLAPPAKPQKAPSR